MDKDYTDLKGRILEGLDQIAEPENGWNLIGMATTFTDACIDDVEQAIRELVFEGKVEYWGADDLNEDGPLAPFVRTEPGWATEILGDINDLPEAP